MGIKQRTWRDVDGERIAGTWRPAFIRNAGSYHLTDLIIYADGMVDCWGLESLDGFAAKLRSGWVATELTEGARASAHHLASWKFAEPQTWLTPEMLLGEVRDTIDDLNQRPNSSDRCRAAIDVFLADQTDENRQALRTAYEAVPEHLRVYMLGDMDQNDVPVQILIGGIGAPYTTRAGSPAVVTEKTYAWVLEYFAQEAKATAEYRARVPADGPDHPDSEPTSVIVPEVVYPKGWPQELDVWVLRNEYPSPIEIGGLAYPTVLQAYWALAVTDGAVREAVLAAEPARLVRSIVREAAVRDGWPQVRVAVMALLLRAKFAQNPDLAAVLAATGETRILFQDSESLFWGERGSRGRNWMGRLLEEVRAELALKNFGGDW
ncbi:putative NAD-dependent protein-ADP-ribosyltransferase YbiA (DUF1768 family) [Catenulispora sp. GAS73]|uniref:NADAR family protein n=1 Tax=Catenulispora sp. GAS73 TaxID=3156269 RepID=UPI003511F23D